MKQSTGIQWDVVVKHLSERTDGGGFVLGTHLVANNRNCPGWDAVDWVDARSDEAAAHGLRIESKVLRDNEGREFDVDVAYLGEVL